MATLNQIQMSFAPAEDRLLLRISATDGTEYRFWLTRRYVQLLWPVLTKILANHPQVREQVTNQAKETVLSFQHEQAVQQADFKQSFKEHPAALPLGDAPLLLAKAQLKPGPDAGNTLSLLPEQGQGIDLAMNTEMVHAFVRLLITTTAKTDWALNLGNTSVDIPTQSAPLKH